jgi:hypothetical protein
MPLSTCEFPGNRRIKSHILFIDVHKHTPVFFTFIIDMDANRHSRCPPNLVRGFEFLVDIRSETILS